MWNTVDLQCPSDDFCEYKSKEKIFHNIPDLINILTTSANELTEENPVWTEIKVLEKIQAQYKRVLQCDKALHYLQRVGSCLRKMVLLNLCTSYLNLAESILRGSKATSDMKSLPSRQQLEYVLIRTQSVVKLVSEALFYARETFYFLVQRLKVGHIILHLLMATSVTARINIIFRTILIQLFDNYKKLYPWIKKLKKGSWVWPINPDLPTDLKLWLKPEEINFEPNVSKDQMDFLTKYFNKGIDDSLKGIEKVKKKNKRNRENLSDCDSVVEIEEISVDECSVIGDDTDNCQVIHEDTENVLASEDERCSTLENIIDSDDENDTGEVVSRENPDMNSKRQSKPQKILLQQIKNARTLKTLKMIWEYLKVMPSNPLSVQLTPQKIEMVDKFFSLLRVQKAQAHTKEERLALVKKASTMLAKYLRLNNKNQTGDSKQSQLVCHRKLQELKKLYQKLYLKLQSKKQHERSLKLKKFFKSGRRNVKIFIQSGDIAMAVKLMSAMSKVFLTNFKL